MICSVCNHDVGKSYFQDGKWVCVHCRSNPPLTATGLQMLGSKRFDLPGYETRYCDITKQPYHVPLKEVRTRRPDR